MEASRLIAGVPAVAAVVGLGIFGLLHAESAASAPAGGSVRVFLQPKGGENSGGKILITGAIGDHGTFGPNVNAEGKPEENGDFGKVKLSKGGFEVNLKQLNENGKKFKPMGDKATCSGSGVIRGTVTLMDGTGRYKEISGTIKITQMFGFLGSMKGGKCNMSESAKPVAEQGIIFGTGKVSF